jgi:hypothetical protein
LIPSSPDQVTAKAHGPVKLGDDLPVGRGSDGEVGQAWSLDGRREQDVADHAADHRADLSAERPANRKADCGTGNSECKLSPLVVQSDVVANGHELFRPFMNETLFHDLAVWQVGMDERQVTIFVGCEDAGVRRERASRNSPIEPARGCGSNVVCLKMCWRKRTPSGERR